MIGFTLFKMTSLTNSLHILRNSSMKYFTGIERISWFGSHRPMFCIFYGWSKVWRIWRRMFCPSKVLRHDGLVILQPAIFRICVESVCSYYSCGPLIVEKVHKGCNHSSCPFRMLMAFHSTSWFCQLLYSCWVKI